MITGAHVRDVTVGAGMCDSAAVDGSISTKSIQHVYDLMHSEPGHPRYLSTRALGAARYSPMYYYYCRGGGQELTGTLPPEPHTKTQQSPYDLCQGCGLVHVISQLVWFQVGWRRGTGSACSKRSQLPSVGPFPGTLPSFALLCQYRTSRSERVAW
eukprot:720379-Rhodomonas_salina.3